MFPSQRPEHIRGLMKHKVKIRNQFGPPSSPPIPIGMSASQMSFGYPIQAGIHKSRSRQSRYRTRANMSRSRHGVSVSASRSRSRQTSAMTNAAVRFDDTKSVTDDSSRVNALSLIYKNPGKDKEAKLLAMPSAWSNQRTNINYRHPFARFLQVVDKSTNDSEICLTCQELNNSPILTNKTAAEKAVFVKLCQDALKNRRAAQDFYWTLYRDEKTKKRSQLSNFRHNKALLGDFMLKLALRRQATLLRPHHRSVVLKHNEAALYLSDQDRLASEVERGSKTVERPVYCLRGWTTVGKPTDGMYFPNSFADLASLRNPSKDPPGYRRYCAFVNMKEFKENEIFMRLRGNCLTFDGLKLKLKNDKEKAKRHERTRIVSEFVELPNGVYPGRLRIGRSSEGMLVIQEPWHF